MSKPIVVGVDGSPQSTMAVEWAALEATRRHVPLRIVNAVMPWGWDTPLRPPPGSKQPQPEERARAIVDQAADVATEAVVSGLSVEPDVIEGDAVEVLRDHAERATAVVIGNRGRGGFSGLLLGSTGLKLADRLPCPLIVVREPSPAAYQHGEIIVGVDGTHDAPGGPDQENRHGNRGGSGPALDYAFEAAELHGARLRALHAWTHPVSLGPGDMLPLVYDVSEVEQGERRLLAEAVAGRRTHHPDVEVDEDVVHAPPARALVGVSARADLLVVGAHRRHPRTGLGSVAHAVLHHAHCPVAIIGGQ